MKKAIVILLILAALGGGAWAYRKYIWKRPPGDQVATMLAAARVGDEDTFIEGFTKESGMLIRAYLALSRSYEQVSDAPYRDLVRGNVLEVVVDGDKATVSLEVGRRTIDVPMVVEDNTWKVDGFALESAF
jgi:hypothetical protein